MRRASLPFGSLKRTLDYRLSVAYDNGYKAEIEDPYNPKFGTIFEEQDYKSFQRA